MVQQIFWPCLELSSRFCYPKLASGSGIFPGAGWVKKGVEHSFSGTELLSTITSFAIAIQSPADRSEYHNLTTGGTAFFDTSY